jgi:alpha-D-ribose 1-methylphosphonate 5-triphosphate synthase subunit PhnL
MTRTAAVPAMNDDPADTLSTDTLLQVAQVRKGFTLHLQGGTAIPVFDQAELTLRVGECVALTGASGVGKSTLLKLIYGNYRALGGRVLVRHGERMVDLIQANPRQILAVRRKSLGYVTQFLRCVPRVGARDVVAEPLLALGVSRKTARFEATRLLERLRLPERLHDLPPATFSGGEQQRVNIARGFVHDYPILLLDEPTASLDPRNQEPVLALIAEAKARGAGIIGIFHDQEVRKRVADREVSIETMRAAA